MHDKATEIRESNQARWCHLIQSQLRDIASTSGLFKSGDQIYVFGSRATGQWDGLSDTDLLAVIGKHHDGTRRAEIESALLEVADDVIVISAAEYSRKVSDASFFWMQVNRDRQLVMAF